MRLEAEFLSSALHHADIGGDGAGREAARYPGASWRRFLDRRHRALWRALATLDWSQGTEERLDALEAESGKPPEYFAGNLGAGKDLLRRAYGLAWLERGLAAAGALAAAGGKAYIRKMYGMMDAPLWDGEADRLAREIGLARGERNK